MSGGGILRALAALFLLSGAVAVVATLIGAETPEDDASGPVELAVVGSLTTLGPERQLPGESRTASLLAARNETESFVLRLEAGKRDLAGLGLAASSLSGPGGAEIAADDVRVHRVVDYVVSESSGTRGPSDLEGSPGPWPDALVPERDSFYGEDRTAFPVDVPAGETVISWVDVFVPPETPVGAYEGEVVAHVAGRELGKVAVRLQVMDARLPSTSSLRSAFRIYPETVCAAHDVTDCEGSEEGWLLTHLYARAALENRSSISNPLPIPGAPDGEGAARFERFVGPLLNGTKHSGLPCDSELDVGCAHPPSLVGAELTSFSIDGAGYDDPATDPDFGCLGTPGCLRRWRDVAERGGFADRAFVYLCDEPEGAIDADGDGSRDEEVELRWAACAEAARRTRSKVYGWPAVPTLLTGWHETAEPRGALEYSDIIAVAIDTMADKPTSPKEDESLVGDQRSEYEGFLAQAGGSPNELWLYAYCGQFSCDEEDDPYWTGWAGYGIDQPASQARAMSWLAYVYDATGELYYSTTLNLTTAWRDQYEFGGHGDGNLFYPGVPGGDSDAGVPAIGGEHPIPVESIRLKRIRDGREDYELLRLLAERGDASRADAVAASLFGAESLEDARETATFGATFEQAELDAARCELATLIDPALPEDCGLQFER